MSQSSQKNHVSILYSPSFLPSLSLNLRSFAGLPACSWECMEKYAYLEVAATGEPSGGSMVGHLAWSILALGGLRFLCVTGQPPFPLSSPSAQTQRWRCKSKREQGWLAAASWKSGLVPDNQGITQTTFGSPLPPPP